MIVYIVGTHRSGTTCISRLLHKGLNIYMGDSFYSHTKDGICPNPENAAFEDVELCRLLAKYLSDSWVIGKPFAVKWEDYKIEDKEGFKLAWKEVLTLRLSKHNKVGFKNPILAPALSEVLKIKSSEIKIIRTERCAEDRLKSINKVRLIQGDVEESENTLKLWKEYDKYLDIYTKDFPCLIVNFNKMLDYPKEISQQIADFVEEPLNESFKLINKQVSNFYNS